MNIRLEQPGDYRAVENLTREAFWNVYRPGCMEHCVLHKLRQDPCFVPELSYVLEEEGQILAHIAYAKGRLRTPQGETRDLLLFGPVSVDPSRQKQGYGSRLIRFTLEKAAELGYDAVVITGSPDYYHRFGFESAGKHGIFYEGMEQGTDFPYFMVKILDPERAEGLRGVYKDPEVYFVSDEEVEDFDRSFPPKKKEKRPGQLEE